MSEIYVQDFVKIRRGTNPKSAFKKTMKFLWIYLLTNSKDFKLEKGITINFSRGYND